MHNMRAEVTFHDPYVPELDRDGKSQASVPLTAETIREADCVIIVTDHSNVDYELVRDNSKGVVDTRNVLGRTR